MNYPFESRHSFSTYESIDTITGMIRDFSNHSWYDSPILKGKMTGEREFVVSRNSLSGLSFRGFIDSSPTAIGSLTELGNETKVEMIIRAKMEVVISFLLLIVTGMIMVADAFLRKDFSWKPLAILPFLVFILLHHKYSEKKLLKLLIHQFYLRPEKQKSTKSK